MVTSTRVILPLINLTPSFPTPTTPWQGPPACLILLSVTANRELGQSQAFNERIRAREQKEGENLSGAVALIYPIDNDRPSFIIPIR